MLRPQHEPTGHMTMASQGFPGHAEQVGRISVQFIYNIQTVS